MLSPRDPDLLTRREALAALTLGGGVQLLAWWRYLSAPRELPAGLTPRGIDLEAASLGELEALPGVGPATARELAGARPIRDLATLEGILGPARLRRIWPWLTPDCRARLAAGAPGGPGW